MRISLVFGAGVAGLVVASGAAVGQFAGGRQPGAPQLPPGLSPAAPVAYQPQAGPVVRASYPTQQADDTPHPWAVKPENGSWMILVKGYVGSDARKLAEELCRDIRDTHKVAAYLFERNAAERKRELAMQDAIRKKAEEDAQPFLRSIEQARKKAEQDGSVFVPTAPRIKVPKPLNPLPEQWAVMIGGFPDGDTARKALDKVRKLPMPKDTRLLEQVGIIDRSGQNGTTETAYINPFASALVVPNPTHTHATEDKTKLEPFIVQLNKDVPNGLLTVRKPWTLMVKSFTTPMRMIGRDGGGGNVFDRAGGMFGKKNNMLDLTAAQATQLCETLRHKDMRPAPMESFILHHRTGSIVTVGQFDAPDDPELLKLQQTLRGMTFQVMDEKTRTTTTERMFDSVSPFPVPKQ